MAKTRVVLNIPGFRALRNSPKVQADLRRRAEQIAAAAGPGHEVESGPGLTRARASVRTATFAARRAESRSGQLTSSIDAARR